MTILDNASFSNDIRTDKVAFISEEDCCRIVSTDASFILQRVPPASEVIHRIGSTEPSALLYDAAEAFANGDPKSDLNVRSMIESSELFVAVQGCIEAAMNEWNVHQQQGYLRAASYGKIFLANSTSGSNHFGYHEESRNNSTDKLMRTTSGDKSVSLTNDYNTSNLDQDHISLLQSQTDMFVDISLKLRVLNSIRNKSIALPITYQQLLLTGEDWLVARLCERKHHLLALRIGELLGMDCSPIITDWACEKLTLMASCTVNKSTGKKKYSDMDIFNTLTNIPLVQLRGTPNVHTKDVSWFENSGSSSSDRSSSGVGSHGFRNLEVATCAFREGRRKLATMLLDGEDSSSSSSSSGSSSSSKMTWKSISDSSAIASAIAATTTTTPPTLRPKITATSSSSSSSSVSVYDQVPLLLSMKEGSLALRKTVQSKDSDLIYLTMFHLENEYSTTSTNTNSNNNNNYTEGLSGNSNDDYNINSHNDEESGNTGKSISQLQSQLASQYITNSSTDKLMITNNKNDDRNNGHNYDNSPVKSRRGGAAAAAMNISVSPTPGDDDNVTNNNDGTHTSTNIGASPSALSYRNMVPALRLSLGFNTNNRNNKSSSTSSNNNKRPSFLNTIKSSIKEETEDDDDDLLNEAQMYNDFISLIYSEPIACKLIHVYYRSKLYKMVDSDREFAQNLYNLQGNIINAATMSLVQSHVHHNISVRISLLNDALSKIVNADINDNARNHSSNELTSFQHLLNEEISLIEYQKILEAMSRRRFVGLSMCQTAYKILQLSITSPLESAQYENELVKFSRKFKLSEKQLYYLRIGCFSEHGEWAKLGALADMKKSPVGYKPFALVAIKKKQPPSEIERYVDMMNNLDEKLQLLLDQNLYRKAAEVASKLRDSYSLQIIMDRCNDDEVKKFCSQALN